MSRVSRYARPVAAVVVVALVALAVVLASRGTEPPPDRAAGLVPADAFLYLHLAAGDQGRREHATEVVDRVAGLRRLRDGLLERASVSAGNFDFESDVQPWLGEEAAAALVGPSTDDARSLLVLEAADENGARAFMEEMVGPERSSYRGAEVLGSGDLAATLADGFVLVGPPELVRRALDVRAGAEPALSANPQYARSRAALPPDRLVDAYASRAGLDGLLSGRAAVLAELPGVATLEAVAVGFSASDERARLSFRGLDPGGLPAAGACPAPTGEASAADSAPPDSLAYFEASNPACTLRGLAAAPDSSIGAALRGLAADLREDADVDLTEDLLPLLDGLTTMTLTRRGTEPPVATLEARDTPGSEALPVLNRLQPALIRLAETAAVAPEPAGGRVPDPAEAAQAPGFEVEDVGGVAAVTAALAPGLQLTYASLDDSLIVSTALEGIGQASAVPETSLADIDDFERLLDDGLEGASAVVFLDLDKLLALGDQIGLAEAPGYSTARSDLGGIGAAAATFSREGDQMKAELLFNTQ